MTQSDTREIRPGLSGLSKKSWLMIVLALPAIGSQLMVLVVFAIHNAYARSLGTDYVTVIFMRPRFFEITFVFLQTLIVNLFGALALIAFFAIRRRVKSS